MDSKPRILIAGIGGASLGTEIAKCLKLAGGYIVYGCDISPLAFGHYAGDFDATSIIEREPYVENILALCTELGVDCIVPGGDETTRLIAGSMPLFLDAGIRVAANDPTLVDNMSNKPECFRLLRSFGFAIPVTRVVMDEGDLDGIPLPCIIKPATGSGGSVFVFFAKNRSEAAVYCTFLTNNGQVPLVQEYLSEEHGEYSIGVLSLPDKSCAGAIAMKRTFQSKLSIATKGEGFLISSGYGQGEVSEFPEIRSICVEMARKLGSIGPLNIQGRINKLGQFVPFEINPRFSGSEYLRAMAGFNGVDYYLRSVLAHAAPKEISIRPGLYLRSLTEIAVPSGEVRM